MDDTVQYMIQTKKKMIHDMFYELITMVHSSQLTLVLLIKKQLTLVSPLKEEKHRWIKLFMGVALIGIKMNFIWVLLGSL